MQREQTATPQKHRKRWEKPQLIDLSRQLKEVNSTFTGILTDATTTALPTSS